MLFALRRGIQKLKHKQHRRVSPEPAAHWREHGGARTWVEVLRLRVPRQDCEPLRLILLSATGLRLPLPAHSSCTSSITCGSPAPLRV